MTFGAFAEVVPGVDGLIHISQIADRRIDKPEDVLSEDDQISDQTYRMIQPSGISYHKIKYEACCKGRHTVI